MVIMEANFEDGPSFVVVFKFEADKLMAIVR
jgi:hypothetical protein